jgi:hypothetical protein
MAKEKKDFPIYSDSGALCLAWATVFWGCVTRMLDIGEANPPVTKIFEVDDAPAFQWQFLLSTPLILKHFCDVKLSDFFDTAGEK